MLEKTSIYSGFRRVFHLCLPFLFLHCIMSSCHGKGEELVDNFEFATVHKEVLRPTRPFGNTPTTRRRLTDMLEQDHMSTKHGV